MAISEPIYGSILMPGQTGKQGLSIWSTSSQLSTATTQDVRVSPVDRIVQAGDLIISYHVDSLGYLGQVTEVASSTSVSVVYVANLAGYNGDWDAAVAAMLDTPGSDTLDRLTALFASADQGILANQAVHQMSGGAAYPAGLANGSINNLRPTSAMVALAAVPDPALPHQAFPSVVRSLDGMTYYVAARVAPTHLGSAGKHALWTIVNRDGVWDWSATPEILTVTDQVPVSKDARDPNLTILPSGDLVDTWYEAGTSKSYWSRRDQSTGQWSMPKQLPYGWDGLEYQSSPITVLDSGVWLATAYGSAVGVAQWDIKVIRSEDEGATWSEPVSFHDTSEPMAEPNLVSLGGDTVLLLVRMEGKHRWTTQAKSTDGGMTFTPLENAFMGTGNPHVLRLRNGGLVVAYRSLENRMAGISSAGHGVDIRTSRDDGATWSPPFPIATWRDMTYASMVETDIDNQVLLVWGRQEGNVQSSIYAMFLSDASGITPLGPVPADSAPTSDIGNMALHLRLATANQAIPGTTYTEVLWDTVVRDDWGGSNLPQGDGGGFTVYQTGLYDITAKLAWNPDIKYPIVTIWNETAIVDHCHADAYIADTAGATMKVRSLDLACTAYLRAGVRYSVKAYTYQTDGGELTSGTQPYHTHLQIVARRTLSMAPR